MTKRIAIRKPKLLTLKKQQTLLRIGAQMANLLFNMKQFPEVPSRFREPGAKLQEEWDAAK